MGTAIHIRSRKSGYYLGENGNWSTLPAGARKFTTALEAETFCREQNLAEMDVVISANKARP